MPDAALLALPNGGTTYPIAYDHEYPNRNPKATQKNRGK